VAQTFKLADKPDPRLDGENKLAFILQRQLRYYSNSDTPTIPQAAMIGSILRDSTNCQTHPPQTKRFVNCSLAPSSLQCAPVSTSKSQATIRQNSFRLKISDSLEENDA